MVAKEIRQTAASWQRVPGNLFNLQNLQIISRQELEIRNIAIELLDKYFVEYKTYHLDQGESLYFAYGSNMDETQMQERCANSRLVGPAFIKDYKLTYRHCVTAPYASIDPETGSFVPVVVWVVSQEDLRALDRYERLGEVGGYHRLTGKAYFGSKEFTGYYYRLPEDRPLGTAAAAYVDNIKDSYHRWGFDYIW
ncbi:MAG TPA: gamma-glutamylcyclotransferase [Clostridiaceae bacterium]|nr:gamma-glutamylcyclotransferase [Clostridiaceae bacterium]